MGAGTSLLKTDSKGGGDGYKSFSFSSLTLQPTVGAPRETLTRSWLLRKPGHRNWRESVLSGTEEDRAGDLRANEARDQHTGSCDTNPGRALPRKHCSHLAPNSIEDMKGMWRSRDCLSGSSHATCSTALPIPGGLTCPFHRTLLVPGTIRAPGRCKCLTFLKFQG